LLTGIESEVKIFRSCYVLMVVNMYKQEKVMIRLLQGSVVTRNTLGG